MELEFVSHILPFLFISFTQELKHLLLKCIEN